MSITNNHIISYRVLAFAYFNNKCSKCNNKYNKNLQIHHIDGNSANNEINNLILLCTTCHGKQHKDINKKITSLCCKKCNYDWNYKGNNTSVTCPNCLAKVENVKIEEIK